jgi:DNA-binding LacI/PurR family transcriptional regulator
MPTIRDVARLAGVSVATVSNVINNTKEVRAETRLRVQQAVLTLGFLPNAAARSLALRRGQRDAPQVRDELGDCPEET